MTAVVFDPTAFKVRYPEFAAVSNANLSACFDEGCLYLSNEDNSPVQNIARRTILLNMMTAHVAYIGGTLNADGQPRPVGRTSSASEGSVSASFEYPAAGSYAWFLQSQYGASFWQATSSLRGFCYRSCPTTY